MKSHLLFLAATVAAGGCLIFSAANAQELPTVLHSMWLQSTKVRYDPLLVATFLLSTTLAIGKTVDILREFAERQKETAAEA
jgi:hypothetical protein